MYPPVHEKTGFAFSFDRLNMLWERSLKYHEMTTFTTLDQLLEDHEGYRQDFEEVRDEYTENGFDRFLIQLSLNDLPYMMRRTRGHENIPVFGSVSIAAAFDVQGSRWRSNSCHHPQRRGRFRWRCGAV